MKYFQRDENTIHLTNTIPSSNFSMNFTPSKYPRILLGIFFCLSFFLAMPVDEVRAAGCQTNKPVIPPGQKLAKIYRGNASVLDDTNNIPPGSQNPCYVIINQGDTEISYRQLLDSNILSADWADKEYYRVFLDCDTEETPELESILANAGYPLARLKSERLIGIVSSLNLVTKEFDGCRQGVPSDRGSWVQNKDRRTATCIDDIDQCLFFMGFEEGDKDATERLKICRDQISIAKDPQTKEQCYKPDPKIDGDDKKFFELTKQMTPACKEIFELCNNGGLTPEDPNKNDPRYGVPDGYTGPLPPCAFSYDGCRNINDILQFLVNIGQEVFKYIGTFAFVMFIYGGFMYIISMGNAEKAKKGQEILTAAIIGIIISFSAYLIIDFVLDALQVGQEFRAIGTFEGTDAIEKPDAKKPNGS